MPRLARIDAALRPDKPPSRADFVGAPGAWRYRGEFIPEVSIPDDAPPIMWDLAYKSETNYLPLLVRTFSQALRVESYVPGVAASADPMRWWSRNRMRMRQGGLHDAALKYGAAYSLELPGELPGEPGVRAPVTQLFTPRNMTTEYQDSESDLWPAFAVYRDAHGHLVLVDEEAEHWLGMESRDGKAVPVDMSVPAEALTYIESRPHGLGHVPVVRFRDGHYLAGEEQFGIVEPLIQLQAKVTETNFEQLVAQYFAAFKQRAIIGWVPESEAEELKTSAARTWYLDMDPDDVRIHEMAETNLSGYIESGKQARRDLAAIGQIPAQSLGVDALSNISDSALSGLNRSKNDRAESISVALGEGHAQRIRLQASIAGDADVASDWGGEVRWADREAQSWSGRIDGLTKLVQTQVLTEEFAVGLVPGLTEAQIAQARSDARRARARREMEQLLGDDTGGF